MAFQIIERLVDPKAVRLRRLAMLETERIAVLNPVESADMWSTSLQLIVQLLAAHAEAVEVGDDLDVAADLFLALVAGSRPSRFGGLLKTGQAGLPGDGGQLPQCSRAVVELSVEKVEHGVHVHVLPFRGLLTGWSELLE